MKMLHFLLYNVYIQIGDRVFQKFIGIPMVTKSIPLITELLLHDYEAQL